MEYPRKSDIIFHLGLPQEYAYSYSPRRVPLIKADRLDQWFGPQPFTQRSWVRLPALSHPHWRVLTGNLLHAAAHLRVNSNICIYVYMYIYIYIYMCVCVCVCVCVCIYVYVYMYIYVYVCMYMYIYKFASRRSAP